MPGGLIRGVIQILRKGRVTCGSGGGGIYMWRNAVYP